MTDEMIALIFLAVIIGGIAGGIVLLALGSPWGWGALAVGFGTLFWLLLG